MAFQPKTVWADLPPWIFPKCREELIGATRVNFSAVETTDSRCGPMTPVEIAVALLSPPERFIEVVIRMKVKVPS